MESIRTTLFLPANYHKNLKSLAHQRKTSMAKLIQEALEKVFFSNSRKTLTARDLCGIAKGSDLSEKDFQDIKQLLIPRF